MARTRWPLGGSPVAMSCGWGKIKCFQVFPICVVLEFVLEYAADALTSTPEGLIGLLFLLTIVGGFAYGAWTRRRYLMDLRILREILEVEILTEQSMEDVGLDARSALESAQRWHRRAYETSSFVRLLVGSLLTAVVLIGVLLGTASVGFVLAVGLVAGVLVVASMVVLAAVVFVLVSDLGADSQEEPGSAASAEDGPK